MFYTNTSVTTPPKDTAAAANVSSDSEDPKPDIERVVVNGDTYAVVNQNKTTKEPKQEVKKGNYMRNWISVE